MSARVRLCVTYIKSSAHLNLDGIFEYSMEVCNYSESLKMHLFAIMNDS